MKKIALHLMFTVGLLLSITSSFADSCTDISNALEGKWTYTQADVEHIIEFQKDNNFITQDGMQSEMTLCSYWPHLNSISFWLQNEHGLGELYRLKKQNDKSENQNIQMSVGYKKFDLIPYIQNSESEKVNEGTFAWEASTTFDGHIFPSWIIATATLRLKEMKFKNSLNNKYEVLGDQMGLFVVAINNVKPDTKVKVEVSLGDIANNSVFEGILKENKVYAIMPKIDYNYQQLLTIKQPTPLNVKFTLYLDGEKVGEQFKTVTIRSINDAPIASINKKGQPIDDISLIFAAYVNENNPTIDILLREAINTGEIDRFVGYQAGTKEVYRQVYSIWNVLQRRGVRYSSITTPTAISDKIFSQYVRFFDDTLNTSQANCIDGTVLFASILRRIGINPKLILVPGHAFLGFDLDSSGKQVGFLETTMIGNTDLGLNKQGKSLDEKLSKILGVRSMKNQKSYNSFIDALSVGQQEATKAWSELKSNKNSNYKIIDIDTVRKMGITPINH